MKSTFNSDSPNQTRRTIVVILLLSAAAINLLRLANHGFKPTMSDFKPIFVACQVFLDDQNPYDDGLIKSKWAEIQRAEGPYDHNAPGLPNTPFVYPPLTLVLFAPSSFLSWSMATYVLSSLNLLVLGGVFITIAQLGGFQKSRREMVLLILFMLSMKGLYLGWSVGQVIFICLFFSLLGIYFVRENRLILAAVCLCIGLIKPLVALPFLLYLLLIKQFRVFSGALGLFAVGNIVVLLFLPENALAGYRNVVDQTLSPGGINDYSFQNERFYGLTGLHGIIFWITNARNAVAITANLILLMGVAFFILKRRTFFGSPDYALIYFIFCSLLFSYHRVYDTLMLSTVFLAVKPAILVQKMGWRMIILIPLMFPITGLVLRLKPGLPVELFHLAALNVPLSLLVLAVLWLGELRGKPVNRDSTPQAKA